MADHAGVRPEEVMMIDDDPAVFGKFDRTSGGLVHIKAFDNPTIQKDDRELKRLQRMIQGVMKYGKNFFNLQFANAIRYTGLSNTMTLATATRAKKKDAGEALSDFEKMSLVRRDRLQSEHRKLRCKVLWCLRWGLGLKMNGEERLSTLFLFDRYYTHLKILWPTIYTEQGLDEAILHMFGCLFIARQYLFTDRKRPKHFRRDPHSCPLWLAHVDAFRTIIAKLTQLREATAEQERLVREASAAVISTCFAGDDMGIDDSGVDLRTGDGITDADPSDLSVTIDSADAKTASMEDDVDLESRTSGGELDEDDLGETSPLSPKDPARDDSPLPHLDNPFMHAAAGARRDSAGHRRGDSGDFKASMSMPALKPDEHLHRRKKADDSSSATPTDSGAPSPKDTDVEKSHPHGCYNHLHKMPGIDASRRLSRTRRKHAASRDIAAHDEAFEKLHELCKLIRAGVNYPYLLRGLFSRPEDCDADLFIAYERYAAEIYHDVEHTRDVTHIDL
jgi:hypothetical protein